MDHTVLKLLLLVLTIFRMFIFEHSFYAVAIYFICTRIELIVIKLTFKIKESKQSRLLMFCYQKINCIEYTGEYIHNIVYKVQLA